MVASVDAEQGRAFVDDGAVLLDVREDNEWAAGHAPQAVHAPMSSIQQHPLPFDTSARVIVICRSGQRSQSVTAWLRHSEIEAANFEGGMHAWVQSGGDIVDSDGNPGVVI